MTDSAVADLSHIPVSQGLSATLARASEGARASGAAEVSLEHVLAALCDDADAIDVLAACNIDAGRLKGDVIGYLVHQQQQTGQFANGTVNVSAALLRILEAAAAAARGGRRRDINGAIVLAAIVGDGRSTAAQILQNYGLTFEGAVRALQSAMAQPRAPEVPPAEDVLARARERVQSRAAPSLREIMQEKPNLLPKPSSTEYSDIVASPVANGSWEPAYPAAAAPAPAEDAHPVAPTASTPASIPAPVAAEPAASVPEPIPSHAQQETVPVTSEASEQLPSVSAAPPDPQVQDVPGAPLLPSPPQTPAPASHAPQWQQTPPESKPDAYAVPPPRPESALPPPHPPGGAATATATSPFPPPPTLPQAPGGSFPPLHTPPPAYAPSHLPPADFRPDFRPGSAPNNAPLPPPWPQPQPNVFDRPRTGPQPPPIPPPMPARQGPGAQGPGAQGYGAPPSVRAPQGPLTQAPTSASAKREGRAEAELGQLSENIPRVMRAGITERVEVRIARTHVRDITQGMDGGGQAWRHEVVVTKAMTVRIRAPEGGFFIETASPETQWIDNQFAAAGEDYASWRFLITPQKSGWSELQIIVSARTVGSDGIAAETAFPDQVVEVKVRTNYGRAFLKVAGWLVAAVAGGAVAKFGEGAASLGSTLISKLIG